MRDDVDIWTHHSIVVSFLRNNHVWQRLIDCMSGDRKERQESLLLTIMRRKEGKRATQKELSEEFFPDRKEDGRARASAMTKLKNGLNKALRTLSEGNGIEPPIQLYFQTRTSQIGGHLACAHTQSTACSENFLEEDELRNMLERASKRIRTCSLSLRSDSDSDMKHFRNRLQDDALQHLDTKLHGPLLLQADLKLRNRPVGRNLQHRRVVQRQRVAVECGR